MKRVANSFKTLGLFAVLWIIVLGLGYLLAAGTKNATWLWIFCGIGLVSTFVAYWNSATFALKQMNAYQVSREQAPQLYGIVEDLSTRMDMPMPTVWIAPTQTPNAFATGRNPKNAAVCCTEGIMQILDERQLRGVLAHELMHVYNRDILTASVASALGGLISTLAQFALFFGGGDRRDNNGGNIIGLLVAMIIAPIAATLIQLGISRTREYSADADGATLTQDPLALASALQRIHQVTDIHPMKATPENENAAALMISNPFRGGGLSKLFSTHPPMEERVARLQQQAQDLGYRP